MGVVSTLFTACGPDVDYVPIETAERQLMVTALKIFRIETGRYPTNEEGLAVLYYNPGILG